MAGVRIPGEIGYKPKYVSSVLVGISMHSSMVTLCLIMFENPSLIPLSLTETEL